MTALGILTIGPAAPADFGLTMAGAAVAMTSYPGSMQTGLRNRRTRRKLPPEPPRNPSASRVVYVEASPQGGSVRAIFGLAAPERGSGLQNFASNAVDPSVNGSLDWRASADTLPGGTPFIDCPADPAQAAVLLSNSGPPIMQKLAASPDLAIVDFGETYMGSPALSCLEYMSFLLVIVTPARPVLARAAQHANSLLREHIDQNKLAFVVRGDAANPKPDGRALQSFLPAPISLVISFDPKAAIGSVKKDKTRDTSLAVREIRTYTTKLLDQNNLIGGPGGTVTNSASSLAL